ncbi:hypothetical protein SERLA73DRAFT_140205, partial [Serpula lacrymans var. lacrymans S7.3]
TCLGYCLYFLPPFTDQMNVNTNMRMRAILGRRTPGVGCSRTIPACSELLFFTTAQG